MEEELLIQSESEMKEGISSKTGFLTKRAISSLDAFANWKQRFFVLSAGTLSYYKQGSGIFASSKDDIAHLKGELKLTPDSIVKESKIDDRVNCFEIITPTKRMYAQADSGNERKEWIAAIQSHINIVRHEATVVLRDTRAAEQLSNDVTELQQLVSNLMKENKRLKESLAQRENDILILEDTSKKQTTAAVLDLRDVRKKQFQLWDAAESGDLPAISNLLSEAVVDVNGRGIDQWTALHYAACHDHPQVAQALLSRGAFVNARTRERLTPLHIACRQGHGQCVTILLDAGADPNLTDQSGNGCIHAAAEGGHIQVVRTLLAHGVGINVPNASGSFPVHSAPIGHPIRVLLSSGAWKESNDDKTLKPDERTQSMVNMEFRNKYQEELALGALDFEFIRVLGRGAFAKVYLVRGKGCNKEKWYALKAYNKKAIVQKNQAKYIHTEKAALQACSDHPFIVTLHYAFQTQDRLCLVMDYCGGGDLLSALTRRKSFTEEETAFYIAQIVLALAHLHSKNIVFRDLKPENIVMDVQGNCLLTDFGISKENIQDPISATTFCGSPMYLAPEMLSRSGHGFALDWYSVGALTYELLTGLPPYYTNDKQQLFHNILKGHLPIPDYISANGKSLLEALLRRDPFQRLGSGPEGAKEIQRHLFFQHIDWDAMLSKELKPPIVPEIKSTSEIPDLSNFPQAFTDQAISDSERGLPGSSSASASTTTNSEKEKKLFQDFDFQPRISLSGEALEFEKLAL